VDSSTRYAEDVARIPPDVGFRDSPRRLILWTIVAVVVTLALLWVLWLVRDILLLIYVSALFAIGFSPVVRLLERQHLPSIGTYRVPRAVAILVVYLVILGVVVGVALLALPPLIRQAREFTADLPRLFEQAQSYLLDRGILREPITWPQVIRQVPGTSIDTVGTVMGALWGFVGGVVGMVTILILTFYFLVETDSIFRTFVRLFRSERRPQVAAVSIEITRKVSAWLGGQLLLAGTIGTTAGIALWLMGVPYFFVLAVIAAIGEMIPVVGPLLAAMPAVAVAFSVSGKVGLGVIVFFIVQQQVENHVLVPKLMERQLGVSAVTVIIALLIGSALLGIVGALLAVPTAAIAQVLFQEIALRDIIEEPPKIL
jgi:predicted PurR-regulated permease PerM